MPPQIAVFKFQQLAITRAHAQKCVLLMNSTENVTLWISNTAVFVRLESSCYHSVQNLLSSSLLSKNLKTKIYRTIILLVVLYGCETWSLTLREEHRLRMFENRVLRRIFGPKRDGVTGEWRKLHNEELNDLYYSPSIVRVGMVTELCAT